MRHTRDLTDQWKTFDSLIPKPMKREDGRGRPWKSRRSVLNGVLWVLRTGAPHPPKRGLQAWQTKRGKRPKIMVIAGRNGLPVSVCVESATPHEVTLAIPTLLEMVIPDAPQSLIGDKAYDSDCLDAELRFCGSTSSKLKEANSGRTSAEAISTKMDN
jgi:hypothetical protein